MRTFENPQNGYRESISGAAWVWCLLFGVLYLFAVGLWGHALWQIVAYPLIAAAGGGPFLIILVPATWIFYAFAVDSLWATKMQRKGWREVTAADKPAPGDQPPGQGPAAASAADALSKLAGLLDRGLLTQDEFAAQKAALLGSPGATAKTEGKCPNCGASVALTAKECSSCKAMFGSGSAWKVV